MERNDSAYPSIAHQPEPSAAAIEFAAALAERLDAIVPAPFRVRAEGGWVALYHGAKWDRSSYVAGMLDQNADPDAPAGERDSLAWYAASVAEQVLSSIQDGVAGTTTEPWPRLPRGGMALPGSRTDGRSIFLWYGPAHDSEAEAVFLLPPIPLAQMSGLG